VKFAAIDIGTNAVRLLLGEDVFAAERISDEKVGRLVGTVVGFRHLIEAYPAVDYMALATSAMRVAENGREVAALVTERTGIDIEIIDGQTEAEVIFANHIEERLSPYTNYLYVDVGGGSTEISIIEGREMVAARSFTIGTVRTLTVGRSEGEWQEMKTWLKANTENRRPIVGIGSGGNINKMVKLARIKEGRPITLKQMQKLYKFLRSYTLHERINVLKLRPDRADVIIPASEIYLSVMKWAKAKRMFVPQFGLSDGIVHILYARHREASQPS
jgi:exopolyphosphatase/guanosine-5'-triphosphate,3'-diphosphate pyrophosphatase